MRIYFVIQITIFNINARHGSYFRAFWKRLTAKMADHNMFGQRMVTRGPFSLIKIFSF